MKLFFLLMLLSVSAFAQYHPFPYPGGYRNEDFCTKAQVKATTDLVVKECDAKMAEFSAEHSLSCKMTMVDLYGCRATCTEGETLVAKLRIDVNSNCRRETASLRKTVIKWY